MNLRGVLHITPWESRNEDDLSSSIVKTSSVATMTVVTVRRATRDNHFTIALDTDLADEVDRTRT